MTLIVDNEPLTEWYVEPSHGGYDLIGYTRDRERRRVTVFLSVHVLRDMGYWNASEDAPEGIIERAAYADPESGHRLPALQNTALPEPAPVFVFPVAKKLLPWEKPA